MLNVGELSPGVREKLERGEITGADAENYLRFRKKVRRVIDGNRVITNNRYTKNAKRGLNTAQVIDLVVQFSVFSNRFPAIEALRYANARKPARKKGSRTVLSNEIGVKMNWDTWDTEGQTFSHEDAHVTWIQHLGEELGLDPWTEMCNWELGTPATHRFLEGFEESYGSLDDNEGAGASFAVETWAGFGIGEGEDVENNNFWKELITGLEIYNKTHGRSIPISFFRYHFRLERGHVASVERESEGTFFDSDFDEEKWFEGARKALKALNIFWLGLERTRKQLA